MTPRTERFLFAEPNSRIVAVVRILLSVGIAYLFYPRDHWVLSALLRSPWTEELYRDVFFTHGYWMLVLVPLAAFGAGLWSRWTGLLAALLLAPCVPTINGITGRYLIWFTLTAFSLLNSDRDWALRSVLGHKQSAPVGPMWPIRLIQCQLSMMYLTNAIAKSSMGYLSGGAIAAMSQQLSNFQVDLSQGVFPLLGIPIPLWLAATASAAVEYSLALGFWFPRLRWPTAALGVTFHWGLMWVVLIGWLDLVCISLYSVFLLPWTTDE